MKAYVKFRDKASIVVERPHLSIQASSEAVALRDGQDTGIAIFPLESLVSVVLSDEENAGPSRG